MTTVAQPSESTGGRDEAATPKKATAGYAWLNPTALGYLIGPLSFGLILGLEHFHLIATQPFWLWLVLFGGIALANLTADKAYERQPTPLRLQARLSINAATTTSVIYLTGWGPILIPAYAIGSLVSLSRDGSRYWRWTLEWSLIGVVIGQSLVAGGVVPSFLSERDSLAVAVMNVFILSFIVRMASATVARREAAEDSARASEQSLRRNEQRFRALVQNSADATLVVDSNREISYASPSVTTLLGMAPEELLGTDPLLLVQPDQVVDARAQLQHQLTTAHFAHHVELRMVGRNGQVRDIEAVVTDLLGDPAVEGYVVNIRDITDRKATEALLVHQAHYDELTGLPNRTLLLEQAESLLERSRSRGNHLAVFFIDIDFFKDVNDTLGHETGDEVLRIVAQRLAATLRPSETVGRIGGDEFVVLVETEDSDAVVGKIADRLQSALSAPVAPLRDQGQPLRLTISVGVAHGVPESASDLLREADIALYQAKLAGRDAWVSFVPEMQSTALRRLQLQSELTTAMEERQFALLYQPIVDIDRNQMSRIEALLRWQHPVRGTITPDQFIPVLEESGNIVEVGRWVVDEACRQASEWWSAGHDVTIGVNASARELEGDTYAEEVLSALARHHLPPEALIIEITEHGLLHATETASRNLATLKQSSVRVAIDDFGTGYSSLAYLLQFHVDVLKIDKSFVAAMEQSTHAMAVVRAILQLGRTLNLDVIAEGIEDSEQLALLRNEGCRYGQGYLFSRPVAASTIYELLQSSWPRRETTLHRTLAE